MKRLFTLLSIFALAVVSCEQPQESNEQEAYAGDRTKVSMATDPIPYSGGSLTATVSSELPFTISIPKTATWLTGSVSGDQITFTATENPTAVLRYASVAILDTNDDIVMTRIEVQQAPNPNAEPVVHIFTVSDAALEAAAFPKDVEQLLKDPDAEDVDWDATSEAEELIESWFDFFGVKYRRGIETELTVYYLEDGNARQNPRECFVMCGDMVLGQFRSKFEIPEGQRKAVSDLALARNAMHQVVSICMGYGAELGDSVYFQYLMPVSVLRAWKRGSSAKEDFRRMLDMLRRYALESLDMMDVAPCTR